MTPVREPSRTGVAGVLIAALLLVGCAKPKKPHVDRPKKEEKPVVQSAGFGSGETVVYQGAEASALPSFSLSWKEGGFDVLKDGGNRGHLESPSGDIYTDGKTTSAYRSDTGDADKAAKRLEMKGNVVLRSKDGTQTLKAAQGEYRGDVRLVRAMGGVTASGPFGTLSGVPELWATPDLRLIGTPDMVGKTLKLPALAALAAAGGTGSARMQGRNYSLVAPGASVKAEIARRRTTIVPRPGSPAVVTILSQNLVLTFTETVVIDLAPKTLDVAHMTTSGAVHLVQTTGKGVTTLDGKGAEYDWKPGAETASLDLAGPVEIVRAAKVLNAAKKLVEQTTTTRGAKGRAILVDKPAKDEEALRSATLTGNVTLDVSEVDGQSFSGSGARMVYTPNGATANVEMTGRTTLASVAKDKAGTRTTVTKGDRGTAVLFAKPAPGANPLKNATLHGNVTIDGKNAKGETFKGSGDKIVYTADGDDAKVVMTGELRFSGDVESLIGDMKGVDTAIMTLTKDGLEEVNAYNSSGSSPITTFDPKAKPKKAGGGP